MVREYRSTSVNGQGIYGSLYKPVMVGSRDPRIPYTWDPIGSGGSQRSEGSDLGFGFFRIRIQDPDHTANTSDPGSTDPDLN